MTHHPKLHSNFYSLLDVANQKDIHNLCTKIIQAQVEQLIKESYKPSGQTDATIY